jgi:hypothetical protein
MECLIIILVVSMIYFILPSNRKKEQWDGSDVDGGTYGVADFNYNTPTFPYDEVVKKKTKKKTDKAKPLPKKVKKKTKRKTKKK